MPLNFNRARLLLTTRALCLGFTQLTPPAASGAAATKPWSVPATRRSSSSGSRPCSGPSVAATRFAPRVPSAIWLLVWFRLLRSGGRPGRGAALSVGLGAVAPGVGVADGLRGYGFCARAAA